MFYLGICAVLWSAMTCSLGFTMDRSALVPPTWDMAPSLDTYQRVDSALNDAVFGSNFSIPFFPRHEFDVSNNSNVKLELQENKHEFNNAWQIIDLSDQPKSVPSLITADSKTEEMNHDSMWNVFDVFSKIGIAIFRSLLESLSRNHGTFEDDFSLHRSFPLKPIVTNLIENTIKKLKSIPNHNGYMLIAIVPKSEQAAIIDLMQHEISPKDTLLVMMQICAGNKTSVPLLVQGPNNEILREVVTIEELPMMIKKAITSNYHGSGYTDKKKRNIPIVSHLPIEIFSRELLMRKRVTKDKDAVEKLDTVSTVKTTITEKGK
ncbi:uncharacterized protein LOC126855426 [Cataglyphis hispanica]|uniref:uncharacterized protein LOC126855426 n=1 Tax=Cataglyphis hispanica TaxID=1086592 RepID=UPI002180975D|nr:uncharacterized protein LOC126855426 [Cataglyphis hispanica]